jgi:RNA polymerase sigma-70 factor (ECF subfamily)
MADVEPTLDDLFQAHRHGLTGAVRSVLGPTTDVAELLQDAFLKCWRHWQSGTRPNDPVSWIFVVVWNVAIDARRARQRRPSHASLDEDPTLAPTVHPSPSRALEQSEQIAIAQAAIAGLSDPEQQVFLLRTSAELSFDAIASSLSIPVGTAKTRMRSALQKLRQSLGAKTGRQESTR